MGQAWVTEDGQRAVSETITLHAFDECANECVDKRGGGERGKLPSQHLILGHSNGVPVMG